MDPITLALLFGTGALAGYAARSEVQSQEVDRDIVLQKVYEWDRWLATELMSPEALRATGQILDLDLLTYWPKVSTGFYKVITITQVGGPIDYHVVVLLEASGTYGWRLAEATRYGSRKVWRGGSFQRIGELLMSINTDPALEVLAAARKIPGAAQRKAYLSKALMSSPWLSAILSQDEGFQSLVKQTVEATGEDTLAPANRRRQRRARRPHRLESHTVAPGAQLPHYPDFEDVPVREAVPIHAMPVP